MYLWAPSDESVFSLNSTARLTPTYRQSGLEVVQSTTVMITVKTGDICPRSGQYRVLGFIGVEITLSREDRVPPYKGAARTFVLTDPTRHGTRW